MKCDGWEGECENENAKRQCQRTQYVDDERNYVTLCPDCMRENEKYWDDMWREYWQGCL